MKNFFSMVAAVLVAAVFTSCNKDSNSDPYPSHLCGAWSAYNSSTGATGALIVKDILDGQYAVFIVYPSASADVADTVAGSFIYKSESGEGYIDAGGVVGESTLSIQADRGTDHTMSMVWSKVSGQEESKLNGTRMEEIDFPKKGNWNNQTAYQGGDNNITIWGATLEVPTTVASCAGLLKFHSEWWEPSRHGTGSVTYQVIDISQFYKSGDGYVYGLFYLSEAAVGNSQSSVRYYLPIKTNSTFSQLEFEYDGEKYILNSQEILPDSDGGNE